MENITSEGVNFQTEVLDGITRFVKTNSVEEFVYAQGYFHAKDRHIQMETLKIAAQGRLCELLQDSDENFEIDKFMRQMSFYHYACLELENLDSFTSNLLEIYSKGVNAAIKSRSRRAHEFILVGHHPTVWTPADTIVTIKIMAFIGLAQGQQDIEKTIIQMIKGGIDVAKVQSLFSPHLDQVDEDIVHAIKKLNFTKFSLPENASYTKYIPKLQSSNNWVISSHLTGNTSIHCSDPHLEINRLPSVWYEMKGQIGDKTYFGISMPGCPSIVMGRTEKLCYSFTYGFMDMSDYFIEELQDGKYREEENFKELIIRKEVIKRKKHHDTDIFIKTTPNGIIEDDVTVRNISDGLHLSHCMSCVKDGAGQTLKSMFKLFSIEDITQMADALSDVAISCNWLITDTAGNITFQQSGLLPKRKGSGLFPYKGWQLSERWQGYYQGSELTRRSNPAENYLISANNDLNHPDFPMAINAPMESYRYDRIEELIKENLEKLKNEHEQTEFVKQMQKDLVSIQARKFITKYRDTLSRNELGAKLTHWNFTYSLNSKEATIFEKFYSYLLEELMSEHFFDRTTATYVISKTNIVTDFYGLFDRLFLNDSKNELWFSKKTADDFVFEAIQKTQEAFKTVPLKPWGEINKIDMTNIFFGGKLPSFLGYDANNIPIPGNRATIPQGAVYQSHGKASSFCPSWRLVTRMSDAEVFTVMPGGLSDRRFSRFYKSDIENWKTGRYRINQI